jgi:hypothetical protein
MPRCAEIALTPLQNASSRPTLVLWPPTTIERFTTVISSHASYTLGPYADRVVATRRCTAFGPWIR